jgi:hypothetical protein
MTTTDLDPRAATGERRRAGIGVVVAAVVVAATVAVILVLGYVPLPAMPSLADAPDPSIPGTVVYTHGDWESVCLATVPASGGEPVDLVCDRPPPEGLAWTGDGNLLVASWTDDGRHVVDELDPTTGEVQDQAVLAADGEVAPVDWVVDRMVQPDGTRLLVPFARDGVAVLRVQDPDGTVTELLRLEGPADYRIVTAQWSPDGDWVLASDSRGRVFVLAADGDPGPRVLADAGGRDAPVVAPAWRVPGDDTGTVAIDDVSG